MKLSLKKGIATLGAVGTLATGGTVIVDRQINPYVDKGTHQELSIKSEFNQGERVEIKKDVAQMDLIGWNNEYKISIKPQIPTTLLGSTERDFVVDSKRPLLSKKLEYKSGDVTAFIEHKSDTEFDIDFTLESKPDTNIFSYKIEGAEEFDFFYQPELTKEEIAEGAERPENVVGSYAVYHKTKANHKLGDTNYATGKAFHIYRPKAIDADGNEVWAELKYENGVLSVVVDDKWLESAVYPVIVDPTFGYTQIGASTQNTNSSGDIPGMKTTGITGTLSSVSAAFKASAAGGSCVNDQYFVSTSTTNAGTIFSGTQTDILTGSFQWFTKTASSQSISGANVYVSAQTAYNCLFPQTSGIAYDAGVSTNGGRYLSGTTWSADTTANFSVYATYTNISFSSSNYNYCKTIIIDNTKVDADLSGFPLTIDITDSDLATKANTDAGDVTFTDNSGNILYWDKELYNSSTGRLIGFASTTLANSSDTVIKMYYGSTTSVSNGLNKSEVWGTNYRAVYHLNDKLDSSRYIRNLTSDGAALTTGIIDGGYGFNGTNQEAYANNFTSDNDTNVSMSIWIKPSNLWDSSENVSRIIDIATGSDTNGCKLSYDDSSNGGLEYKCYIPSTGYAGPTYTTNLASGTPYHIVGTYDDTNNVQRLYLNGVEVASTTETAAISWSSSATNVTIGARISGLDQFADMTADEARIINTILTPQWVKTEYNNQSSTSTFYTISSEFDNTCSAGGGGGAPNTFEPVFFFSDE